MPANRPRARLPLRRLFVVGVLTLLPIWVTWVVLRFIFTQLSNLSKPWVSPLLAKIASLSPQLAWMESSLLHAALALIGTLLIILFSGWLATRMVGQKLLQWFESMIARVPLVNSVYSGARKLLDIMQTSPEGTQRVVLIDFPHKGMKTLGLVTKVVREEGSGRELAAVYVPTTPNPTSGYLEIVPVEELIATDWTVDQAMSFIISGGAVSPDVIPFGAGP